MGFTDDRRFLWAGGLDDSKIFVFDVGTDPAKPKIVRRIPDFASKTGYRRARTPSTPCPAACSCRDLSNTKDNGGATGFAVYSNRGELINVAGRCPPTRAATATATTSPSIPQKNVMLSSSFAGRTNYMRELGKLVADGEAMKKFGNTMVVWDLKALTPKKVLSVPGRAAGDPLVAPRGRQLGHHRDRAHLEALAGEAGRGGRVAGQGRRPPSAIPPRSRSRWTSSISRDGTGLWVNTFMDGKTRYFDLTNPEQPKQTYEKVTGKQVNMISQSWDGKRVYIASSLLANWDKGGDDNEQFVRAFKWDGKELTPAFAVDFIKEKLGRAHHMKFGSRATRPAYTPTRTVSFEPTR